MKKTSKLLSMILILIMIMSTVSFAFAESKVQRIDFDSVNEIMSLSDLEKIETELEDNKALNPQTEMESVYEISSISQANVDKSTTATNTDPNNAYVIPPDFTVRDTFTASEEQRWYAMEITEASKLSTILLNDTTLDSDLYVYKLNETTMILEPFSSSTYAGLGVDDFTNDVADAGIYYFVIYSYSGSGIFNFTVYTSTYDVNYEVNDTVDTAAVSEMVLDNFGIQTASVEAVIDNPTDYDYFAIDLPNDGLYQVFLISPDGKEYQSLWSGDGQNIYTVSNGIYTFSKGVNYFGVRSLDGSYSSIDSYNFSVKKIKHATFDDANYIGEWNDHTYTMHSDLIILVEEQNAGYFKFKVTPGHRLYIKIGNGGFDDEGLKVELYDSNKNLVGSAGPGDTVGDGLLSFLPINVDNTSNSTQIYYIRIIKPTAREGKVYGKSVNFEDRIKTGRKTFNFRGTASKSSGSGYSSTLNIDLRNDSSIPNGAIFTGVSTKGTQSPIQGRVYHEVAYGSHSPQTWHRAIAPSSSSGIFNIPSNYVAKVWYFRYYSPAAGSSTMRKVSISFKWEYDLALNGYERVN
ncbi:MAG: hypothetical protein MJA82_04330 [Clostridia bacterium]|nr:hypothetical protein [Clostridia bacterium]